MTRDDVKRITEHITTGVASSPINDLTTNLGEIPLNPRKENYEKLTWWDPDRWQAIRGGLEPRGDGGSGAIINMFMEDENGDPISEGIKKALRSDAHAYWNELLETNPKDVRNYSELGLQRKEHFRNTFEAKYPWLRLCSGHWKVDHVWMGYFGSWKNTRTAQELKKESSPVSASAVLATSPLSPHDSKRRLEDEESLEESARRKKAREMVLMAPTTFHHSRPQAKLKKKAPAKMAKVRPPSPPFSHTTYP